MANLKSEMDLPVQRELTIRTCIDFHSPPLQPQPQFPEPEVVGALSRNIISSVIRVEGCLFIVPVVRVEWSVVIKVIPLRINPTSPRPPRRSSPCGSF